MKLDFKISWIDVIVRLPYLEKITQQFRVHAVCGLIGPRQSGKTTVSHQYADHHATPVHRFDLEHPDDLASLQQPMRVLEHLTGLVILDEIQRLPELFPILRVLSDQRQAQYLILGSASPHLLKQSSESLAGRVGYIELMPLHLGEVTNLSTLLTRGGFPKSYLAPDDDSALIWRQAYIQNFLERDIPALGFSIPAAQLRRFWMMLTHIHAQQLNMHQIGVSFGISGHTVRSYLDILEGTFMIRMLQPWYENISKRQVKMPKLFFRDVGILLAFLNIKTHEQLLRHPSLGAIWEGFALEQVIQHFNLPSQDVFYWRTSQGAELDLLIHHEGNRLGFEFKFSDSPKTTRSMRIACQDLNLHHLYVIYPGKRSYPLDDRLSVIALSELSKTQF